MSAAGIAAAAGCCCRIVGTPCTPATAATESLKPQYDSLTLEWALSGSFTAWQCCGQSFTATMVLPSVSLSRVITTQGFPTSIWRGQVASGSIVAPATPCIALTNCCPICPEDASSGCARPFHFGNWAMITCLGTVDYNTFVYPCADCVCCKVYTSPNLNFAWCDEPCVTPQSQLQQENYQNWSAPLVSDVELRLFGVQWRITVTTRFVSPCATPSEQSSFAMELPTLAYAFKSCMFAGDGPIGDYGVPYDCSTGYCNETVTESTPCGNTGFITGDGTFGTTVSRSIPQVARIR